MAENQGGFSNEAVISLLIAFVSLLAGILVDSPAASSFLLVLAGFATSITIIRHTVWYLALRIVLVFAVVTISSIGTYGVFEHKREKDLHARYGTLSRGDANDRPSACAPVPNQHHPIIDVFIGSVSASAYTYPYTVLLIDGQPDLIIDQIDGKLVIKRLRLRDDQGKVIVRIDDNDFNISDGFFFNHPDNDLSKLAIINDDDDTIFSLSFLNGHQVAVTGRFKSKDESKIIIGYQSVDMYSLGTGVKLNLMRITRGCIRNGALSTDAGNIGVGGPAVENMDVQINP